MRWVAVEVPFELGRLSDHVKTTEKPFAGTFPHGLKRLIGSVIVISLDQNIDVIYNLFQLIRNIWKSEQMESDFGIH